MNQLPVRLLRLLAGLVVLLGAWGACPCARAEQSLDYLTVEANEGDSSGGHAALRMGDETFHFQHEAPGIIRVRRFPSDAFIHVYARLGNRAIRESGIPVTDETFELVRDAFVRRFVIQEAQIGFRDALRADVRLFESLLQRTGEPDGADPVLPLEGFGYFLADGATAGSGRSPALAALRDRVARLYGERFLEESIGRAEAALRAMEPVSAKPQASRISPDLFPVSPPAFSTRYGEHAALLWALRILREAPALRPDALVSPARGDVRLGGKETEQLRAYGERLEMDLASLVASSRTDRGLPLAVGMARLAAVEASLAAGRLLFLDIFPGDASVPAHVDAALRPWLPAVAEEKHAAFRMRREEFFGGRTREADYGALERAGNLLAEVDRAIATGAPPRRDGERTWPSRPASLAVPAPGPPDRDRLERELASARDAAGDYEEALRRVYAYDLFRRNCVTEVFSLINAGLAEAAPGTQPGAARRESERRLGGYIDSSRGLTFAPFISAREVAGSYAVAVEREIPSCRTARLAELARNESTVTLFLRESNTLTSTVYRPGPDDSFFLFFTDDTVVLRPLFGAFNLLAGVGESLYGILTLPADHGRRLAAGGRGMLFSLPELLFLNIRKGSMAYVEDGWMEEEGKKAAERYL